MNNPDLPIKNSEKSWQVQTDVVVVGFGGAGAVAAITVKDAGADVIILEKQSAKNHTPNTMMSGGGLHTANNIEAAAKYYKAVAFGIGLPQGYGDPPHTYPKYPSYIVDEMVKTWSQGVYKMEDFLQSLGNINIKIKIPGPAFTAFPGAQHYGTVGVEGRGIELFNNLAQAVNKRGIKIYWQHSGKKLIYNNNREVIGISVETGGQIINIKARKAVILATGGFACNEEMKKAFLQGWGWNFTGNPGNTGDGIKMAMDAGAALSHMYHCSAHVTAGGKITEDIGTAFNSRIGEPGRIMVDNYGRRYSNELLTSRDPDRYSFYKQVITYDTSRMEYPRIPSWFIFDETARQKGPVVLTFYGAHAVGLYHWSDDNSAEVKRGWILEGNSIQELAARIASHRDNNRRMNATILLETINRFNENCKKKFDPDFQRPAESLGQLDTPPYYALAQYPGGPNTEGGLLKNARSQVLDVFGNVIARLYAAGEIASAWNFLYQAGGNLAECVIYGRVSGKNAAQENPWS